MNDRAPATAQKAIIDTELQRLCRRAKVRVRLPAADPKPGVGPFSHLRAALGVLPEAELVERLPAFEASWLRELCLVRRAGSRTPPPAAELADEKFRGATREQRDVIRAGAAVALRASGEKLLVSPLTPAAAVFTLGKNGFACIADSVAEFVKNEVAAVLGETTNVIAPPSNALPERVSKAASAKRELAALTRSQVHANEIRASLVVAFQVEGFADASELLEIVTTARARDLEPFTTLGDAENAGDAALVGTPWLFGVVLHETKGGTEQKRPFRFDAALLARTEEAVDAGRSALVALCKRRKLTLSRTSAYLVARGGECLALLLKGTWCEPPARIKSKPDSLAEWLSTHEPLADPSSGSVGYRGATRGASQSPFPGLVRGIAIAGADSTAVSVKWSAAADSALDRKLSRAKLDVEEAGYYLLGRFD